MELLKVDEHFIVSDFVSNGSFASLKENVQYKSNEDYAILVRITDFVKNWNGNYVYINETEYNFLNKSKIFPGDLIVSNVGQPGLSFILPDLKTKTSLAPNSIFVRPKTNRVNNLYFHYFLKTPDAQKLIDSICTKTTLKKFNKTSFRNLILPFPSYENQIRIANLLEKIETAIAERKNTIDLLDELVKSTFYQMFGDPVKNEKGWNKVVFSDLIIFKRGFDLPTSKRKIGGFPLCSSNGITDRINEFKVQGPGIFTGRSGTIGNVFVTYENYWPLNTTLFSESYNGNIIYLSYLVRNFRLSRFVNGTGVPTLNRNNFNKELIIDVPIELQNQFAGIAQKIESIRAEQEVQLKDLEELYASVSQKVFAGDIDLSKVPFDASLLPNESVPIETSEEEPKPDVVKEELSKEEIKKVTQPATKRKLNWENVSFKEVANYIQNEFNGYYFNAEMLLRYLKEDIGMVVNYFSSVEQKKKPQYENADDFYRFVTTAITGENSFLQLEQVFYNAETENIPNISFTETDLVNLAKKDKKERSGIYFRIKDEITTP
ncbi:restriction endonuclease subunit S [Chryseobacterium flavum]|uniref:restriction endonuclease subunit S n=1 Tax=Chryseobacterium flavum TaxID=415851 RepID=UPI002FD9FC52